jgi:hypothetical protein
MLLGSNGADFPAGKSRLFCGIHCEGLSGISDGFATDSEH